MDGLRETLAYTSAQTGQVGEDMPYCIRLFGPFAVIAADGRELTPRGRKACAVLSYAVLCAPKSVRRERLIGLLWGDRGEEQARASLRQALHELRPLSNGKAPLLLVDRANIRIDPSRFESDLEELRLLAASGDADGVASLLDDSRDELLLGLLGVTTEFDEWLLAERAQYRDERRAIATKLGRAALAAGDAESARRLARLMLATDPFDEAAARLAMEACAAAGDIGDARRVFARLETVLRRDLDVAPSPTTLAVHDRLREPDPPPPSDPHGAHAAFPELAPASAPAAKRRLHLPAVALAAVLLTGLVVSYWNDAAGRADKHMLLIEQLHAPTGDRAGLLLWQSLSNDLTRMVVGSDTALTFADQNTPPKARAAADYVVTGETQTNDGQLHAALRLISGRDRTILWSGEFSGPADKIDALRQRMAVRIADVLVCALGARSKRPTDIDPATLRLFLAGCENWHTDWAQAKTFFGQVVARRPDFAQARGMYAEALNLSAGTTSSLRPEDRIALRRQARAEALTALQQDPHIGAAYQALAATTGGLEHWPQREAILRKGIAADPQAGELETALTVTLGNVGRTRESIEHAERASALDPFAPVYASNLAEIYAYNGRVSDADRLLEQANQYWPDEYYTSWTRFEVAARVGDAAQAKAMLDNPARNPGYRPQYAGLWRRFLDARIDRSTATIDQAARAMLAAEPQLSVHGRIEILQHLVQLGKIDDAFTVAMRIPPVSPEWGFLWFRDYMAPFRADPRFLRFARKQGLLPLWSRTNRWPDFCRETGLRYRCSVTIAADART
jgi:DNA-binding SARP family transcriptional activator